jgi:hypothetical protein
MSSRIAPQTVEVLLERLYLGGGAPRDEERKKAREVAGLLELLAGCVAQPAPRGKARVLVDAAAGHGYVGLCAAALLGWRRVVAIERDADRVGRVRAAAAKLEVSFELDARVAELGPGAIPSSADLVIGLHACGAATDALLDAAITSSARWILCAPCCYGEAVAGWSKAQEEAARLGLPKDAAVRSRFAASVIDGTRLLRIRAAGYEATLVPFTTPTVTPHHLAFRARRGGAQRRQDSKTSA